MLQARVLLDLGRDREARDSYLAALAVFPQLRDAGLDARLATVQLQAASALGPVNVVSLDEARRRHAAEEPAAPSGDGPTERTGERLGDRSGFGDIGGLDDVETQIRRKIILPFERRGLFDRSKKRAGGGVLLYGPPGCGKTLLARATAGECGASFTAIEITDVLDKYIGESQKRGIMHQAHRRALS